MNESLCVETAEMQAEQFFCLLGGTRHEIRHLPLDGDNPNTPVKSGVFDNPREFAETACGIDGTPEYLGVYTPVNAIREELPPRILQPGHGVQAKDIARYSILFTDVDATRFGEDGQPHPLKGKICATDEEHQAALDLAERIRAGLSARGWADPAMEDTGNGGALFHGIDLPKTPETGALIQKVLAKLAAEYDTNQAHVDQSTWDAPRLAKIPGTTNTKLTAEGRPSRPAMLLSAPRRLGLVTLEQLEEFAGEKLAESSPTKSKIKPDISLAVGDPADWAGLSIGPDPLPDFKAMAVESMKLALARAKIAFKPEYEEKGAIKFDLEKCPCADHPGLGDPEISVWADGSFGFDCKNDTCVGINFDKLCKIAGLRFHEAVADVATAARFGKHRIDDPLPLAQLHLKRWGGPERFAYFQGQAYRYSEREGGWIKTTQAEMEPWISQTIQLVFEDHAALRTRIGKKVSPKAVRPSLVSAVYAKIKSLTAREIPWTEQAPFWLREHEWDAADLLVYRNGILNVRHFVEGNADYFRPLTPDLFSVAACDFDFDPNAPRPTKWLAFLDSLQRSPEWVACLQEVMGYLHHRGYDLQRIIILAGVGGAGKGIIADVMRALAGGANAVCAPSLDKMTGTHGLETMPGKSLALIPEMKMPASSGQIIALLRALSGAGEVEVNRKYLPTIVVRLWIKIVGQTNDFLVWPDNSGAIMRRLLTLPFSVSFVGKENPSLAKELKPDYPGIVLWALEGLKRLRQNNGQFTFCPEAQGYTEQQRSDSAPIKHFLEECCTLDASKCCQTLGLYETYVEWCQERYGSKAQVISPEEFPSALLSAVPSLKKQRGPKNPGGPLGLMISGVAYHYEPTPFDTNPSRPTYWLGIATTTNEAVT